MKSRFPNRKRHTRTRVREGRGVWVEREIWQKLGWGQRDGERDGERGGGAKGERIKGGGILSQQGR